MLFSFCQLQSCCFKVSRSSLAASFAVICLLSSFALGAAAEDSVSKENTTASSKVICRKKIRRSNRAAIKVRQIRRKAEKNSSLLQDGEFDSLSGKAKGKARRKAGQLAKKLERAQRRLQNKIIVSLKRNCDFPVELLSELNTPSLEVSSSYTPGDLNGDGFATIADAVLLVAYLDGDSSLLPCAEVADINGSGMTDMADVVALLDWLFRAGGMPVNQSCDGSSAPVDPSPTVIPSSEPSPSMTTSPTEQPSATNSPGPSPTEATPSPSLSSTLTPSSSPSVPPSPEPTPDLGRDEEPSEELSAMVLYLPLSDSIDDGVTDNLSLESNDGTCSIGNCPVITVDGEQARFRFVGTTSSQDRVDVASYPALEELHHFTLSLWLEVVGEPGPSWGRVVHQSIGVPDNDRFALVHRPDDYRIEGRINTDAGNFYSVLSSTSFPPGSEWSHIALSFDGRTLRLFVNGQQEDSTSASGSLRASTGDFAIGAHHDSSSRYFNGHLSGVSLHQVALTNEQILAVLAGNIDVAVERTQFPTLSDSPDRDEGDGEVTETGGGDYDLDSSSPVHPYVIRGSHIRSFPASEGSCISAEHEFPEQWTGSNADDYVDRTALPAFPTLGSALVRFAAPSGTGSGLSSSDPMSLSAAVAFSNSRPNDSIILRLADGYYGESFFMVLSESRSRWLIIEPDGEGAVPEIAGAYLECGSTCDGLIRFERISFHRRAVSNCGEAGGSLVRTQGVSVVEFDQCSFSADRIYDVDRGLSFSGTESGELRHLVVNNSSFYRLGEGLGFKGSCIYTSGNTFSHMTSSPIASLYHVAGIANPYSSKDVVVVGNTISDVRNFPDEPCFYENSWDTAHGSLFGHRVTTNLLFASNVAFNGHRHWIHLYGPVLSAGMTEEPYRGQHYFQNNLVFAPESSENKMFSGNWWTVAGEVWMANNTFASRPRPEQDWAPSRGESDVFRGDVTFPCTGPQVRIVNNLILTRGGNVSSSPACTFENNIVYDREWTYQHPYGSNVLVGLYYADQSYEYTMSLFERSPFQAGYVYDCPIGFASCDFTPAPDGDLCNPDNPAYGGYIGAIPCSE